MHKILLVEDNPGDADLTSERLSEAAPTTCDLRLVTTLADAMRLLPSFAADAIILDLNLPDSLGLETLRRLKPVSGDAAIVVVSGLVDESLRSNALIDGAEEVFAKSEAGSRLFARSVLYVIERNMERNGTRERHRQLQRLLDSTPDAIIVMSLSRRVRYANQAAAGLFERTREGLVDQLLEIAIEQAAPSEIIVPRADGDHVCEVRLVDVAWDGEPATLAAIRDITERKRAETLRARSLELEIENSLVREANRSKTEFLANMSHELRTPLNSIIGFTEILYDEEIPVSSEKQKTFLGYVLTSARHLLRLINDVLDLAKVEAGKLDFNPVDVSLSQSVDEVTKTLGQIAAQKQITIDIDLDSSIDRVFIDPLRFKQLLYNYLSNALKFTPENGRVAVRSRPETAETFRISVHDSGSGIPPEQLGRLFVQFQQLDGGTSKQHEGTGLGLALTKRLVEAQGGRVGVDSVAGKGSVFFAVLPRHAATVL